MDLQHSLDPFDQAFGVLSARAAGDPQLHRLLSTMALFELTEAARKSVVLSTGDTCEFVPGRMQDQQVPNDAADLGWPALMLRIIRPGADAGSEGIVAYAQRSPDETQDSVVVSNSLEGFSSVRADSATPADLRTTTSLPDPGHIERATGQPVPAVSQPRVEPPQSMPPPTTAAPKVEPAPISAATAELDPLPRQFSESTVAPLPAPSPVEPTNQGTVQFCPSCGEPTQGAHRFCGQCGKPLPNGDAESVRNESVPHQTPSDPSAAVTPPVPPDPSPAPTAHASPSRAAIPRFEALAAPVTIQGRPLPLDVWILVGCAYLVSGLFAFFGVVLAVPGVQLIGGLSPLEVLLGIAALFVAIGMFGWGFLFAWIGTGVLNRKPEAPWLGATAGSVTFATLLILIVQPGALDSYPMVSLGILIGSAAVFVLAIFAAGIHSHTSTTTADDPPIPVSVSAGVGQWLAFLFGLNAAAALTSFVAFASIDAVDAKLLLIALPLAGLAGLTYWGARQVVGGNPAGRIALAVGSALAAVMYRVVGGSSGADLFSWMQVLFAVVIVVLLWLPDSTRFFAGHRSSP